MQMMRFEKNSVVLKGEDAQKFLQLRKDAEEGRDNYTEKTYECIDIAVKILSKDKGRVSFSAKLKSFLSQRFMER